MATFKYYNLQVLPLDGKEENLIGSDGYKKIFSSYSEVVNKAFRERKLPTISHDLMNDMQFSFKKIEIKDQYAQGKLIKFDHIDRLVEVYTNDELYENKSEQSIASSKRVEFDFVFDFKKHILAVEAKQGLPSTKVLIESILSLLASTVTDEYASHYIKIIELTDASSLEKVLDEADYYKKVSVEFTFTNSDKLERGLLSLIDENSRENNIHTIKAEQKPPKDRSSKAISMVLMPLIILSTKLGNSDITYMKDNKEITYHMREYPVKKRVGRDSKMTDDDYYSQIFTSITNAEFTARTAEETNKKLLDEYKIEENE